VERDLRVKVSKFVSYVLRHDPRGLMMDEEGFVDVDELVSKVKGSFPSVDGRFLRRLVEEGERKRFEIVGNRIRALYGHSVLFTCGLRKMDGLNGCIMVQRLKLRM